MAKRRARRRSRKSSAARKNRGKLLNAHPTFGGNKYDCHGKRVRHRGGGTHPAVYCGRRR
jgi:hypothetical protein